MSIHDYVDFIQRNKEINMSLILLKYKEEDYPEEEEKNYGSCEAILVRIPKKYNKRTIISWSLDKFRNFAKIECEYDWTEWDFDESLGYHHILKKGYDKWWDLAIWESLKYPNEWLINFDVESYHVFILGKNKPDRIPWNFYKIIMNNRDDYMPDIPDNLKEFEKDQYRTDLQVFLSNRKRRLFERIVNSGEANLFIYDNLTLPLLTIPSIYINAKQNFENSSIFNNFYLYQFRLNKQFTNKKLMNILICNLSKITTKYLKVCLDINYKVRFKSENIYTCKIFFLPNFDFEIKRSLLYNCLICNNQRTIGQFMCDDHISNDLYVEEKFIKRERQIEKQAIKLCKKFPKLNKLIIPKRFELQNQIILSLIDQS